MWDCRSVLDKGPKLSKLQMAHHSSTTANAEALDANASLSALFKTQRLRDSDALFTLLSPAERDMLGLLGLSYGNVTFTQCIIRRC